VSSTQSSFQILAEAISARLPKFARRAVIHLPTQTFKILRAINRLTDTLGKQVVREKKDAARQGLDIGTDLYGQLRAYSDVNGSYFGKTADRVHSVEHGRTEKNSLTEEELMAQTAILLVAGQDTTVQMPFWC
jgi:cytochrome P450